MDTVYDVYGQYYKEKARDIPRQASITPEAQPLWQRMEDLAWSVTYANGSKQELDEAVKLLAEHPGSRNWKESTLWYYLDKKYCK